MGTRRVLIVGGVAGGASCAARLRRLDESGEIIVFERGPYVSFANCGLPYYVGNVIQEEKKLLVATPGLFRNRFNIEVRTGHEVTAIDRQAREIEVREAASGRVYRERYDALVLSPGAAPVRPPLPGIDLEGIFTLRTIPDSRSIREWIEKRRARRAVVVGAGFIGLEMTENLAARGLEVTLLEAAPQVMPLLDREMANLIEHRLRKHGVHLRTGDPVTDFEAKDGELLVKTKSRQAFLAEMVILSIGVKPESGLARAAGVLRFRSMSSFRRLRTSLQSPRFSVTAQVSRIRPPLKALISSPAASRNCPARSRARGNRAHPGQAD